MCHSLLALASSFLTFLSLCDHQLLVTSLSRETPLTKTIQRSSFVTQALVRKSFKFQSPTLFFLLFLRRSADIRPPPHGWEVFDLRPTLGQTSSSEDAVGEVLEVVVELCGERVDGSLDHLVDERVQLVLRQVEVEARAHVLDRRRGGQEAGERRAWKKEGQDRVVKSINKLRQRITTTSSYVRGGFTKLLWGP